MADTTTKILIDEMMDLFEGVAANATSSTRNRRKAKRNLQSASDWFWGLRDWPWKTQSSSVGSDIGAEYANMAFVLMDQNFIGFGRDGGLLYIDASGNYRPMRPLPLAEIVRLQATVPRSNTTPVYYCVAAMLPGGSYRKVLIYPAPAVGTQFLAQFVRRSPILDDETVPVTGTDELCIVPEQFHRPVIYERAVLAQMIDKGSLQAVAVQRELLDQNVRVAMVEGMRGREGSTNLVPYGAGWGGLPS